MTLDVMESVISQVDPSFVWELDLARRGEPTIHPQFDDLLKIMSKAPVPTAVVTTGVTLNQRNVDALVNNIDLIRLSVSSINENAFRKVHIGLDYKKIWKNIAVLAEAAPEKVIVHLTGGPAIYESMPDTVNHLRSIGLVKLNVFPLWNRGGSIEARQDAQERSRLIKLLKLNASESEYAKHTGRLQYFLHLVKGWIVNKQFCIVGDSSLSIGYRGEILGCFQDFGHVSNIGSMSGMKLKDAIKIRTELLGCMKVCVGCNSKEVVFKRPIFL